MTVVVNEAAIGALLNSTTGPVGIHIANEASKVAELAQQNASGPVIGIESYRLVNGISTRMEGTVEGVRAIVGTDAVAYDSQGGVRMYNGAPFSYPAFHDQNGRPWLTQALIEVFPG
jgi:hypothetical protein